MSNELPSVSFAIGSVSLWMDKCHFFQKVTQKSFICAQLSYNLLTVKATAYYLHHFALIESPGEPVCTGVESSWK